MIHDIIIKKSHIVDYNESSNEMENIVSDIINNNGKEYIWFLQHYDVYTAGTNSIADEFLGDIDQHNIIKVGRGGKYTWHGIGQRVVYFMLNLRKRKMADIKLYINFLQSSLMESFKILDLDTFTIDDKIGVWCKKNDGQFCKIAAIGIKLRRWITFHGIAININNDLKMYDNIIPCGIKEYGVTSLQDMGIFCSLREFDDILLSVLKNKLNE
ncbi:MAG: lipoyl(octanoyl) transferase LipB [Anaplasmataceae bacterium]|nr:lipoyl(octanoyl) transferase LipB [Anaplasmataceae bacterium]